MPQGSLGHRLPCRRARPLGGGAGGRERRGGAHRGRLRELARPGHLQAERVSLTPPKADTASNNIGTSVSPGTEPENCFLNRMCRKRDLKSASWLATPISHCFGTALSGR